MTDRFIWSPSPYRAVNTSHRGYENQSVYGVSGTSRCLFSDKYKAHKYSVGRAYSCWMLNLLVHHINIRLQKVNSLMRKGIHIPRHRELKVIFIIK